MNHLEVLKQHIKEIADASVACIHCAPIAIVLGVYEFLIGTNNSYFALMLIALVVFDFFTAIMAKYKIGEVIESRKALKTVTKIAVYGVLFSSAHLTEMIVPGTTFLEEAALSFLALAELISILENIGKMGYAIPQKMLNKLEDLRDK